MRGELLQFRLRYPHFSSFVSDVLILNIVLQCNIPNQIVFCHTDIVLSCNKACDIKKKLLSFLQ